MLENKEKEDATYFIPKWFIWIGSVFMASAVPWATWVTKTLLEISIRNEVVSVHAIDIKSLQSENAQQNSDISVMKVKINSISHRIDLLETKQPK